MDDLEALDEAIVEGWGLAKDPPNPARPASKKLDVNR